ncbi:MAG: DJ-1/PfpI family protein [Campylobacter sp.]|nr:DJ-1/PfpI family protein [Campylobacter sp.]
MKKVAVMLAEGFEEIEAITIVDVLRRADIDAKFIGLNKKMLKGAHGIEIVADEVFDEVDFSNYDMIALPGGLPGAKHLARSKELGEVLREFDKKDKWLAAICAAPWGLSTAGVLKDSYTCYPGFESQVAQSGYKDDQNVVIDQNIITSRGPATAMEFALNLVKILEGKTKFQELKEGLLFK